MAAQWRGANIAAGQSKRAPGWHAPGLINAAQTICKPTRATCEKGASLHRPDGLGAILERPAKQNKEAPSLGVRGALELRCRAGLSSPPALRLSQPYWLSKRGEHSAGPALWFCAQCRVARTASAWSHASSRLLCLPSSSHRCWADAPALKSFGSTSSRSATQLLDRASFRVTSSTSHPAGAEIAYSFPSLDTDAQSNRHLHLNHWGLQCCAI